MMHARFLQPILWLALLASSGCELVADFDRSKIDVDRPDSGVVPPPPDDENDAGTDASAVDASAVDASDDDAG